MVYCRRRKSLTLTYRADEEYEEDVKDDDEGNVGRKVICELGAALQLQDDVENDHRNEQTDVET